MKRKAASRQLCNGHCRSLTLPVHNHRTGCKDRLKHNRLQYPQIGISRLRMVIRRGKFPFAARHWLCKTARQGCCNYRVRESRRAVCVLSAFSGHVANGFVPEGPLVTGTSRACLYFVCISGTVFKRVSVGRKICLTYFELCQTYFKIHRTYFFFAPMRG